MSSHDPLLLRLVVAAVRHDDMFGGDRPKCETASAAASRVDSDLIEAAHQYAQALSPVDRKRLVVTRLR